MRFKPSAPLLARAAAILPLVVVLSTTVPAAAAEPTPTATQQAIATNCQFLTPTGQPSAIKHVVHVQFDNVHLSRDMPNVPSDLEQMPHLLNFIKNNGSLLSNNHTPLIAHTAHDLMTGLTGVYGDRNGIPVSNSFEYYNISSVGSYNVSAFTYWTDRIPPDPADPNRKLPYELLDAPNHNLQAPWVPFVQAGCNVGAVSDVDMVLENNGNDINQVFGSSSAEASESANDRTNDFVGLAVHCADTSCSTVGSGRPVSGGAKPEFGGQGVAALYGHKYISSQVPSITTTDGTPITGFGQANGFNPTPEYTLGYMEALLKANVPVVYGYVADAHDSRITCAPTSPSNPTVQDTNNGAPCGAFAPGEPGYVAQLKLWDNGFDQFFQELDATGINSSNTLFIFQADENDHYTGSQPTNAGCDGVTTSCHYDRTTIGEVTTDLPLLLKNQSLYDFGMVGGTGSTPGTPRPGFTNSDPPYAIDFDTAPGFWLKGHPANGSAPLRKLEKALSAVTSPNPYLGHDETLFTHLVDRPGLEALHMITSDDDRTPGVVGFSAEDHFIQTTPLITASNSTSTCNLFPAATDDTCLSNGFLWLHGNYAPDIDRTWAGFVGPGVAHHGEDATTWADHTDLRPTLMTLVCLKDSYSYDGRALLEDIDDSALPRSVVAARGPLTELGQRYKQLNAPVGDFGQHVINLSTLAIRGNDATYAGIEGALANEVAARDRVAASMQAELGMVPGCGGLGPSAARGQLSVPALAFDVGNLDGLRRSGEDLIANIRDQDRGRP